MQFIINYSWLIPILPLLGVILNGLPTALGIKLPKKYVYTIGCGVVFLSFLMSVGVFAALKGMTEETRQFTSLLWPWMHIGALKVDIAFLFDPLSSVMTLVVTGVGFLIHVYSTGYMNDDPSYARFFTYMNLFCFMMLVLVLGDNMLLLFLGWEGVGLCSYLLIAFWHQDKANGAAGMKAFVVNRIGDFGMMMGLMVLFWALFKAGFPTLKFVDMATLFKAGLQSGVTIIPLGVITLACLLLFLGACGKSAQIPLYVWLPDAMAGPTPVSALIHAATMVTAGVYLIARMNWLFVLSETALVVVATVGAFTAFVGATIGFAQNDIKKVLAYSTVSQLGYMMLAMGTGAFAAGVFHLTTHAFFKACLFLGSGSVIMAMHHEQDMRHMGGLKKYMPITFITFLMATIAICGIFPFAGFFSKDEILWQVFNKGSHVGWYYFLWALGLVGAAGTAFYMIRLVVMTFFGTLRQKNHDSDSGHHEPKESPLNVTIPLIVLGALSVVAGFLNVPYIINHVFGGHSTGLFNEWLGTVIHSEAHHEVHAIEWVLMIVSVVIAGSFMYLAYVLYTRKTQIIKSFTQKYKKLHEIVLNKYYVDEFYHQVFVLNLLRLNKACAWFDAKVIDGVVNLVGSFVAFYSVVIGWADEFFIDGFLNGMAKTINVFGAKLRKIQTGHIQQYAYVAVAGVVIILVIKIILH